VREFAIDRENSSGGRIRYFWNVGKAFQSGGSAYVPLHKVAGFGVDFFTRTEGVLLCSDNILTENDPDRIRWETLPDGDVGIRAPEGAGPIAEEHSFAVLSDGAIFCVYRTVSGYSACSYSRDGGRTWSDPEYMRYSDGRRIKNSRSATFIWKLSGNRYLYWMNNHSGKSYADRNPIWFCAAKEADSPAGRLLVFSQPEIMLYTDDITRRISYPDLLETKDGDLLLTATDKQTARIHRIPAKVLTQVYSPSIPPESDRLQEGDHLPVIYDREGGWDAISGRDTRGGFTIELVISPGAVPCTVLDNRLMTGRGFAVWVDGHHHLVILLSDGRSESHWRSTAPLDNKRKNHVVCVIDGGPKTISLVINGKFDDGGETRQFGFGLFHPFFQSARGGSVRCGEWTERFALYCRAVLTAEAVALHAEECKSTAPTSKQVCGGAIVSGVKMR